MATPLDMYQNSKVDKIQRGVCMHLPFLADMLIEAQPTISDVQMQSTFINNRLQQQSCFSCSMSIAHALKTNQGS